MNSPISSFKKNLESIKMLDYIHDYFSKQLHALDLSEILRAEIVLLISAFDCYIHDSVKVGMIEIFSGHREENLKFQDYSIPFSFVMQIVSAEDESQKKQLVSAAIKKVNSTDSYQTPRSIENILQLISIKKIWSLVKDDMNMEPNDIRNRLGIIVNRRNKIAHEADLNPISGEKTEILSEDVKSIRDFITQLVDAIDKQINTA